MASKEKPLMFIKPIEVEEIDYNEIEIIEVSEAYLYGVDYTAYKLSYQLCRSYF